MISSQPPSWARRIGTLLAQRNKWSRQLRAASTRVTWDQTSYGPEIGVVSLNRPEKLNALDRQMFVDIKDMAQQIIDQCNMPGSTLQAVLVHGNGKPLECV